MSHIGVLKIIAEKLDNANILWMLIGSTNLSLQGLDILPRDLDITITHKQIKKAREIFSEYNCS